MADEIKTWSDKVVELGVDALVDAGIVQKDRFDEAARIVAIEIHVRLSMGDRPDPNSN